MGVDQNLGNLDRAWRKPGLISRLFELKATKSEFGTLGDIVYNSVIIIEWVKS
ncbi:hypothetical protein FACS1894109_06310 [Spirochaetia bacterium]|nr:hypothetical protein FACS1894109_06310 [Spirochaetia bacterium]